MATKIIMIRHGFSRANEQERFAGHWDIELTALGKKQAEMAGKYFETHHADALYSSDLQRAYQTAVPISRALGLPIHKDAALREICAGEWEEMTFAELTVKYAEDYAVWMQDVGKSRCNGGESVLELTERVVGAVRRIAEKHDGQTVCITTHATPIRAMCTVASGTPVEEMVKIPWVSNASINIFEYENGSFRAVALDQTEHLGELRSALPVNV